MADKKDKIDEDILEDDAILEDDSDDLDVTESEEDDDNDDATESEDKDDDDDDATDEKSVAKSSKPSKSSSKSSSKSEKKAGFFTRVIGKSVRFTKETVAETKNCNFPTIEELKQYTTVCIVFVIVVMLFITIFDFGIGQATFAIFNRDKATA
jgi:preprotein translocase subunit SecE